MDSSAVSARLIGTIFVEKGLITEEQLELALEQQRATGDRIGEILVDQFGVERLDLASALAEQWAEYERQGNAEERERQAEHPEPATGTAWSGTDVAPAAPPAGKRPIGEIFVERGLVTDGQLEEALTQQRETGARLGEILVASGKLSRLELASALADQWASFQKLRPPAETPTPTPAADPTNGDIRPTPEAVALAASTPAPAPAAVAPELAGRVDALAARVDQVAAEKSDWKPQLEKTAELLRSRLEHLEEAVARHAEGEPAVGGEDLRAQVAELAARIDAIPAPSDEWRSELAQVAENLRTRIEHVQVHDPADQIAELRISLAEVTARIDALRDAPGGWEDAAVALTARIDALPVPSEEWRGALADLANRVDSLPAPTEDWHEAVAQLAARIDALPVPSEEWRGAVEELRAAVGDLDRARSDESDLRGRFEALAARVASLSGASSTGWDEEIAVVRDQLDGIRRNADERDAELRASVADLTSRMDALPVPADEWREPVANLSARLDSLPVPSEEWRGVVADLSDRVDGLGARDVRAELLEVAADLRARVERVEQGLHGEEIGEMRAQLDGLAARVEALPAPSEEWRGVVSDLAARIDVLPLDGWRSELAEVAENLRVRVERVEQGLQNATDTQELSELRAAVQGLSGRVDSLPVPSEEWRGVVADLSDRVDGLGARDVRAELSEVAADLRARVERVEQGLHGEEIGEMRAQLDGLAARVEALPAPSEEWRGVVSDLAARIDVLPLDGWRSELAEVAENLRVRVERVEQGLQNATDTHALDELRATLEAFAVRFDALPVPSDEWRVLLVELSARVDQLAARDSQNELLEAADSLKKRIERIEQGLSGQARAAAVTQIAEQVNDLIRKFDGIDAVEERLEDFAAQIDALPASSDEWRGLIADLTARVDAMRTDGWKPELSQVAEGLRTKIERVARDLGHAQTEQLEGLAARIEDLGSRVEQLPGSSDEVRAELGRQVKIFAERMTQLEQRVSGAAGSDAFEGLAARVEDLGSRVEQLPGSSDEVRAELGRQVKIFAERMTQLEQRVSGKAKSDMLDGLAARIDDLTAKAEDRSAIDGLAARLDELAQRAGDTSVVENLSRRVDELAAAVDDRTLIDTLSHRVDELASRRGVDELDAAVTPRLEEIEGALSELRAGVTSLPVSFEARVAAAESSVTAATAQTATEAGELRNELQELRESLRVADESASRRVGEVADTLDSKLDALDERFVSHGVVHELRARVEQHEERVQDIGGELVAFERHAEEKAAGRSAELGALRARLEAVEDALHGATGWSEAVEGAHAKIDGLEMRLLETAAAEADERNAEIASLRAEVSERVEGLESLQVTPRDLKDLRDIVEIVERRVDDRAAHDEAARRALEDSVRSGLKGVGKKLSASGEAYLETSRELTRSLAGLEAALSAATTGGVDAPRATDRPGELAVFLAFAPTVDGYRLIECQGTPPELEGRLTVEGCEGELVVTRIGSSPLPFDTRPCVYLEHD